MLNVRPIKTTSEQERFCAVAGLSTLTPGALERSRADAHWIVDGDDGILARCSLWWSCVPQLASQRIGLIGHYAAYDDEAAVSLLRLACKELARQGCTLAVGPMDGSTDRRYRLLSERGTEPPFFLEPDNPDDWPHHFMNSGFTPLAHYYSALQVGLEPQSSPTGPRVVVRPTGMTSGPRKGGDPMRLEFVAGGITLRQFDLERFEDELHRIYGLVVSSFRDNFLASPLAEEDFLEQNRALRPYIRPELIQLAEREGEIIGFIFAVPDWLQMRRGATIDTIVIKTLAVHPTYRGKGLGTLLMNRLLKIAHGLGYQRAIHALMHENNYSLRISRGKRGEVMRRYTLYAQSLEEQQ
ncbi:MAG TPA: GNAT family N-acetyltransferase [Ktedonosporobacter sp.]|nr:GNAT family N-acetyltransferase [Ktedonosporobacter sp.]